MIFYCGFCTYKHQTFALSFCDKIRKTVSLAYFSLFTQQRMLLFYITIASKDLRYGMANVISRQ